MDSTKIYTNKVNSFYTDCFQNIDFFGERFAFQFKDKNTYRSNLGGGIYFVYCLLATVYLCYTFNNLLSRVNYSFNYSFTTSLPSIINLTKNEFFLIDNNKIFQNISFLYNNYSLDEELEFQKNKTFETKNCESNISYNNNNASCFNSNITLEYNQFGYTNSIYLQMDLSSRNFSEKDIIFFEMIFQETSFNAKKVSERNLPFENVTRRQKIYFKRHSIKKCAFAAVSPKIGSGNGISFVITKRLEISLRKSIPSSCQPVVVGTALPCMFKSKNTPPGFNKQAILSNSSSGFKTCCKT